MTSEVVVMNKLAIAMAADSAVTVSGGGGKKIYDSANKLFALSKRHPIGVMIYNNANLLGLPIEAIVKEYRGELGSQYFDTVREHMEHFVKFLNGNKFLFPAEIQAEHFRNHAFFVVQELMNAVQERFTMSLFESASEDGKPTVPDLGEIVTSIVSKHHASLNNLDLCPSFTPKYENKLLKDYWSEFSDITKECLEDWSQYPWFDDELLEKIVSVPILRHTRSEFGNGYTGFVFGGFGKQEMLPHMCSFKSGLVVDSKIKYADDIRTSISIKNFAALHPFAQSHMTESFMYGASKSYRRMMYSSIFSIMNQIPKLIISQIDDLSEEQKTKWVQHAKTIGNDETKKLLREITDKSNKQNYFPLLDVIGGLPKDELAIVAETFVNLNSFQKKVSMEDETVGGAVDVAVISRGDGLVWIKRKHYFEPNLNHHFFTNYFSQLG